MEVLTQKLLDWYGKNARALPWRTTYEPYHILVSEFMLQQTQMERGVLYFKRWLQLFPTIFHVAEASEEQILHAWEGLGYYRRARFLHEIAKRVCSEFNGIIPDNPKVLSSFKGIGDYTVAALCGIGFNQPIVTIDANVDRVFSRLFCIEGNTKQKPAATLIKEKAYFYLPPENPRAYNQSLMELGSLICNKKTYCEKCPIQEFCKAYQTNTVALFPHIQPKQQLIYENWLGAFLFSSDNYLFVHKRPAHLHWAGLFDIFSIEAHCKNQEFMPFLENSLKENNLDFTQIEELCSIKYSYTNHRNTAYFYKARLNQSADEIARLLPEFMPVKKEALLHLALPSPYRKAVQQVFVKL